MDNRSMFQYSYSAKDNQEILAIRNRYLPREETKLEELKRLDRQVQSSGMVEALSVGVIGCLIFGLGMCLAMKVIGNIFWLGILLGAVGSMGMVLAYPLRCRLYGKARQKYTPRIIQLAQELSSEI